MRYANILISAFMVITLCSRCANSTDKPSHKDIEGRLEERLHRNLHDDSDWKLNSFEITVEENIGSKVEPLWKFRFKGAAELNENLYISDRIAGNVKFIKKHIDKGLIKEFHGIATAQLRAENWNISYDFEGETITTDLGRPLQVYEAKGRTIITGTKEEKEFISSLIEGLTKNNSNNIEDIVNTAIDLIEEPTIREALALAIEDHSFSHREKVSRELHKIGDSRGKRVLVELLCSLLDLENKKILEGSMNIGISYKLVKELGQLGDPEAIPSITHLYKYQRFGNTPRSQARSAIYKIGKPGLPYLRQEVVNIGKWYFSAESRKYHEMVYDKKLSDQELKNISWGPKYLSKIVESLN